MPNLETKLSPFRARIKEVAQEKNVPGLSVAVRRGEDVWTAAAGIANIDTGQPVIPETKFLIGSNTKVMTATLIMQLVDEGKIELEAPATRYLPKLAIAADGVEQITIQHLLNHTSGIEGDYFDDFGRGNDALRLYVESLKDVGLIHEIGRMFSYCNSGWGVLGLILEQLHGKPYHDILREKLLKPLGLGEVALFPEESILGHSAVGHDAGKNGGLKVTANYLLPHAMGPVGSVVNMTARGITQFGQLFVDGGKAPDGTRILSESAAALMQKQTVVRPGYGYPGGIGLGWMTVQAAKHRVITHGGGTTGQLTSFLVLPDEGLSLAAFSNGPLGQMVCKQVLDEINTELVGFVPYPAPKPADPAPKLKLGDYTGAFESISARIEIGEDKGRLTMQMFHKGPLAPKQQDPKPTPMDALDDTHFLPEGTEAPMSFIEKDANGVPQYFFMGRAVKRVS